MALKYCFPGVVVFLISACTSKDYNLQVKFDPGQNVSTLYLTRDNERIDSITGVGSYYGKDILVSVGEYWDYNYKGRCGTGCSITYYMRLTVVEDKIKPMLNILNRYSEEGDSSDFYNEQYIPHLSDSQNYVLTKGKNTAKGGEVKTNLLYNKHENIYYNEIYKIDGNDWKGIHLGKYDYVFISNRWKFYNPKNKMLSDLM